MLSIWGVFFSSLHMSSAFGLYSGEFAKIVCKRCLSELNSVEMISMQGTREFFFLTTPWPSKYATISSEYAEIFEAVFDARIRNPGICVLACLGVSPCGRCAFGDKQKAKTNHWWYIQHKTDGMHCNDIKGAVERHRWVFVCFCCFYSWR